MSKKLIVILFALMIVGSVSAQDGDSGSAYFPAAAAITAETASTLVEGAIYTGDAITQIAWSPDGSFLAIVDNDQVIIQPTNDLSTNISAIRHENPVTDVVFAPDGSAMAISEGDSEIRYWEFINGISLRAPIVLPDVNPVSLAHHPQQRLVAFIDGTSSTVNLWDVNADIVTTFGSLDSDPAFTGLAFSPDGTLLYSGQIDGDVTVWDVLRGTESTVLEIDRSAGVDEVADLAEVEPRHAVSISGDGSSIAATTLANERAITVWDVASGAIRQTFVQLDADETSGLTFYGIRISPASDIMATAGGLNPDDSDNGVYLWDIASGEEVGFLPHPGARSVAFSADGATIASAGGDSVRVWRVEDSLPTQPQLQDATIANIVAYCDTFEIEPLTPIIGDSISIVWSWYATERELINDHIEHAQYTITVNGNLLAGWRFRSQILPDETNNGDWTVYWYALLGHLEAGAYDVEYNLTWDAQISDGYGEYGPDSDVAEDTGACRFRVESG